MDSSVNAWSSATGGRLSPPSSLWTPSRSSLGCGTRQVGIVAQLAATPNLLAEVQSAIDAANASVSKAEAIRKFAVLEVDWTEETGELTPTLKLKRNVVLTSFHDDVEALYI